MRIAINILSSKIRDYKDYRKELKRNQIEMRKLYNDSIASMQKAIKALRMQEAWNRNAKRSSKSI